MAKKKKTVDILCIIDRSGSMDNIIDEAVGAFNAFVDEQKKLPGKARLTLVAFDHHYEVVFNRIKIADVPKLKRIDVEPRGMTALNDAIGRAISGVDNDNTVCLIQTDGEENYSQEFSNKQIRDLITRKQEDGWDISFIGADVDAFAIGAHLGVDANKCLNVTKTSAGMDTMRSYASATVTSYRTSTE